MSLHIRDKWIVVLVVWRIAGLRWKNQQRAAVLIRQEFNASTGDGRGAANAGREHLAERVDHGGGGATHNWRDIVSNKVGDIHQTRARRDCAAKTAAARKS